MVEAMKDCCNNVWAVVEIIAPNGGFDCNYFRDKGGGTQYRNRAPSNISDQTDGEIQMFISKAQTKAVIEVGDEDDRSTQDKRNVAVVEDDVMFLSSVSNFFTGSTKSSIDSRSVADITEVPSNNDGETESKTETPPVLDIVKLRALTGYAPFITIRMLPSAIPDTRNFE